MPEIMIHKEVVDQQPQTFEGLIEGLEREIETLNTTVEELLDLIALDKRQTAENKGEIHDASNQINNIKTSLTRIGELFSTTIELGKRENMSDTINPVISHGYIDVFKNWIGTQIIQTPEKYPNLSTEDWSIVLRDLSTKIQRIKEAVILLGEIQAKSEQEEQVINRTIGGSSRIIRRKAIMPVTTKNEERQSMAGQTRPIPQRNETPANPTTPHGTAARIQTRTLKFIQ